MLDAVRAAWAGASTPPGLREACLALAKEHERELNALMLLTIGCWVSNMVAAGHDRHVCEQVMAASLMNCTAILMRASKERRGEPYVPARHAIVAYAMATSVAATEPFAIDFDAAVAAYRASLDTETAE